MANIDLKEKRKQMLPSVTAFSPRDSLSKLSSPLGLPKEFSDMEQKLQEMHTKEEDSLFRNSPSPLPKGAPPLPVVPHPQGRDKLKIAGTDDLQSFGIARKACALKGERYFFQ